tara:strand:+ start:1151 stop:1879 length:729 start_codon:yes stop_codon:yes gene_type:complete
MKKFLKRFSMIILCGGRGKRLGEITKRIPKPMVKIGGKPIIQHKISYYISQGIENFTFCLGYKGKILEKFLSKKNLNGYFSHGGVNTGILKRIYISSYPLSDHIIISYGDTLAKINFNHLMKSHIKSNSSITLVVAPIRNPFGLIDWDHRGKAINFKEKPILNHFIGYAVLSPKFFKKINKKIINLKNGEGIVKSIQLLIKKKEVNIYKFEDLQVTINSKKELKEVNTNFKKYFTLNENSKK